MQCVLVINKSKLEGSMWRDQLKKKGYTVLPECTDLSAMVDLIMREKVHIVLCSADMVGSGALTILRASTELFPRIKIIIVGFVQKAYILSNLTNVAITKSFESALKSYCKPVMAAASPAADDKKAGERNLRYLLDDHYLSQEEAAAVLNQTFKWTPGYVVIGIVADSSYDHVLHSLKILSAEMRFPFMLQFRLDEFYIVLHDSPTAEFAIQTAAQIRLRLLAETDAMFSIGISRMRGKAGELYACRKEAFRACGAAYMFGQNSVIHIDYLDSNDIEYIYPKHKEQRLIEATMDGNVEYAFKMLDQIFEVFKSRKDLRQGLLNKMVLGIVVNLNIAATSRVSAFEKMQLDSLALSKLLAAKTADEAYAFLKKGIEDFAGEMDSFTDVSREALFYRLTAIKKADKSVSILDLPQKLGTTAGFINTAIHRNCQGDVFSFFVPKT